MGKVSYISAPRRSADFVDALFSNHDAELRRFLARMLGSAADAADVAQEAYLKLYRLCPSADVAYPRALLFRVATNLAIDHLKRRKDTTIVAMDIEPEHVADDSPPPERRIIAHDAMRWLGRIIDELPPKRRRVLVMHKIMGMTRTEVATELGITLSMVEQHLTRALAHCRQRLIELEID